MVAHCKQDKPEAQVRHELRVLFEAGLPWQEARSMVVPVLSNMKAAYRAEWFDWEKKRKLDEATYTNLVARGRQWGTRILPTTEEE
jgi:hypothetical protein